jgi:hypothetical protein
MMTRPNQAAADKFCVLGSLLDSSHLIEDAKANVELGALMHSARSASHCRLIACILQATWSRELKGADFLKMAGFEKMWDGILTTPVEAAVTISRLNDTRRVMATIEDLLDLPRSGVVDEWLPTRTPTGWHNLGWSDRMCKKLDQRSLAVVGWEN